MGPDRRHRGSLGASLHAGVAILAIVGTLLLSVASFGLLGDAVPLTSADSATIGAALGIAAALSLAMLCAIVWHVDGRASAAWFTAALALLGLGVVLLGHLPLSDAGHPAGSEAFVALGVSSRLVAIVLFMVAALGPEVVSALRPFRALVAALGGVGALTVALQVVPGALPALATVSGVHAASGGGPAAGSLVVVALWTGALGLLLWRRHTRRDPLLVWMAGLAGALALAEVARWPGMADAVEAGGDLLRSGALALVALGVAGYLLSIFADQRRTLLNAEGRSKAAEAQLSEVHEADSELRHEARNALTSIAMATRTLQRFQDCLAPDQREQLATAVCREIERLEHLLGQQGAGEPTAVSLRSALSAVVATAASGGDAISVEIPPDLEVVADEQALVQVVANLLANARRHAPGSPVTLRTDERDGGVVLRCEDRGPGVPADERQRIFARGVSGPDAAADSRGLGLNVAARLVRQQGGHIWVEDRPGGGASFGLWLPAPERAASDAEASASPSDEFVVDLPELEREGHVRQSR